MKFEVIFMFWKALGQHVYPLLPHRAVKNAGEDWLFDVEVHYFSSRSVAGDQALRKMVGVPNGNRPSWTLLKGRMKALT